MRRRFSRLEGFDFPLLVGLSLAFFVMVVWSVARERDTEWRPSQEQFAGILERYGQIDAARNFTFGVKQIWIPALSRVDRCVSCHLGYEWGAVLPSSLPVPFAPHPEPPFMKAHPFPEFGCTVCHGGQGFATEERAAHGRVEHWDEPLLAGEVAARNEVTEAELIQLRCNGCHRREETTPGLEAIDRGKVLFAKHACLACHVVEGEGGLVGPELTYIGDKNPELLDFSRVAGPQTVFNWHVQHLISAETVSPGTTMPAYGFAPEDARALALLMVSWRRETFPPRYIPPPPREAAAEAPKPVREIPVPPAVHGAEAGRRVYLTRGCNSCHTVGGGRLIGPDLKGVGARRDAAWLRTWLADPATMMRAYPELADWPSAYGGIVMPNQNLSREEIEALVSYVGAL